MPGTDGANVSRAELNAHLQPMRENIQEIKEDVHEIREALGAGPRWMGARMNAVVDKVLPTAVTIGAVWALTRGR